MAKIFSLGNSRDSACTSGAANVAGNLQALATVVTSGIEILNHNIETVPRLYGKVRPGHSYEGSLQVLREDPANATGLARLAALRSCAINVGFKLLATLTDETRKLAANSDQENLGYLLDRIPVTKRLLEIQSGVERPENGAVEMADAAATPANPTS